MSDPSLFKWRHFEADIILCAVRWYLRYALSYRDVEELMRERGVWVDHTTVFRWVQRYAPELDKRCRPQLKVTNDSYRVDETYIKIKKHWYYLHIPRMSATRSMGKWPLHPREACHPVHVNAATWTPGRLPPPAGEACHPRSAATLGH
jgi:hypothetical protein